MHSLPCCVPSLGPNRSFISAPSKFETSKSSILTSNYLTTAIPRVLGKMAVKSLIDKYPVPKISFGVEMEFNFAVSKARKKTYEEAGDGLDKHEKSHGLDTSPDASTGNGGMETGSVDGDGFLMLNPNTAAHPIITPEEEVNNTAEGSNTSRDEHYWPSMQRYVRDLLGHSLPHSPRTPSLLRPIARVDEDAAMDYRMWNVTGDVSVEPTREDFGLHLDHAAGAAISAESAARYERTKKVKEMWRVSGIELISPVLKFEDEEEWLPMFEQVERELSTEHERAFFYHDQKRSGAGLHVHVALRGRHGLDSPLGLECVKNLLALYGLFEDEIGRWLQVRRRDDYMAKRIRLGLENTTKDGVGYIPHRFMAGVYKARDVKKLVKVVSGFTNSKLCTVNLSPARAGKPMTLEFRQHHGVIKAEMIKWWVVFLGHLVKYSYFLAQLKQSVRDATKLADTSSRDPLRPSFVEKYSRQRSILDVVGMPEEGKRHFARMADKYRDDLHDARRELDLFLIQMRIEQFRRRKTSVG